MNMNFGMEFEKYAVKHMGIGSNVVKSVSDYQVEASMTPYILEERNLNVTQMDVFSRLMRDRILFCTGGVDSRMSDIVQAQLLFLDSVEKKDITLYLNTPGGSVLSGLGIVDVMNHVGSDIATVNIGMCASMGSVLLSSGAKGKRSSLLYSKVMTHQVSHGTQGNVQDTRINQLEAEKYNFLLFKLLAKNCGKTFDQMIESSKRDRWFNSDEALEFGLVDEVIGRDEKNSMTNLLDGFEEYYKKEVLS